MTMLGSNKKIDVLADNILRAAGMSVDDVKSLSHIFKDAAALFCEKLRQSSPANIDAEIRSIEPLDDAAFEKIVQNAGAIAPLRVGRWGCTMHIAADRTLVFAMLEALFGAQGNLGPFATDRPLTAVECKIAEMIFAHMSDALDRVFATSGQRLFQPGKAEDAGRFDHATLERPRLFTCTIAVTGGGKAGHVHILLPRSSHRPMQDAVAAFLRRPMTQSDPAWTRKMRHEVSRAQINVEAFIQQGTMTLAELAELEIGQVLKLPSEAVEQVRLRSHGQQLFKCKLGKSGIHFTVKVGDPVNEEEDLIDELVAG